MKIQIFFLSVFTVFFYMILFFSMEGEALDILQTEDGLYYRVLEGKEIEIIGGKDALTDVIIPCEIDGIPVTKIADNAFLEHTRMYSVLIPDTVQYIGNYAFYQCVRLECVLIPDSIQDVGWGILLGTRWLEKQTDPFVIIGNQILIHYNGMEELVIIPNDVRMIAGFAFDQKRRFITEVQISDSVKTINAFSFAGCVNLKKISLSEGLEEIGQYAFYQCKQLSEMKLPDSVVHLGAYAFEQCVALQTVILSESLQEIETAVFLNCTSLSSIVLGSHIHTVGQKAFLGCSHLRQVVIQNANCMIYEEEITFPEQTVLIAEYNSTIQQYADTYQRSFVASPILLGDMDKDGRLMVEDAVKILQIYACNSAGLAYSLSSYQKIAADYDQNGYIGVEDAIAVLTYYARSSAGLQKQEPILR